jgi:hypothetical protein
VFVCVFVPKLRLSPLARRNAKSLLCARPPARPPTGSSVAAGRGEHVCGCMRTGVTYQHRYPQVLCRP